MTARSTGPKLRVAHLNTPSELSIAPTPSSSGANTPPSPSDANGPDTAFAIGLLHASEPSEFSP